MDRTVQVVVGIVALLFCQESCLHFCQAEQDAGVSSCLPLGEPPQTGGLHLLTTYIPFYGTHLDSFMQTRTGSLILYNWGTHNYIIGEILVYMNRAWEEAEVSFFVWDANSSSVATLAQISQMVQSSPAANSLEGGTTFVPQYATIFSWRIRQSGIEDVIFQAVLATADGTSFLVLKYCTDNFHSASQQSSTTAIVLGYSPTLLFRDLPTRRPLYVLRMDQITCTEDAHYYCITGPPHNFSLQEVTSTTAKFSFQETLRIKSTVYSSFTVHYTVSCSTKLHNMENSSTVETVNASTAVWTEVKQVEVTGLRPFFHYTCRLLKEVVHLNRTIAHPQAIRLVTRETAPTAAPMDLRVVNVTSNSAVIVWSPIPPRLANGDVCYVVKIASVSTPQNTINESLRETKLKVTGLEADTVHLVTVTGHTGKGAGPSSEVMQFRTLKNSGSSSSPGPSPSISEGVATLPTNTYVIPNSSIPIPTSNIGIETGEGTSSATPGDVAAIFMAILFIATIGTVVVVVVVVFLVNRRYLREKNSQTNDVETKEDKSRSNSPELVWYQPGDGGTHVQIREDQDAVSSTSC